MESISISASETGSFSPQATAAAAPISSAPPPPPSPLPPEHVPAYAVPEPDDEDDNGGFNKIWIIAGAALLLLLAILYYFLFLADDGRNSGGTPTAAAPAETENIAEAKIFYANSTANIRDAATTKGSNITGKLSRGDKVSGSLVDGDVEGEQWLELEDGGFVSLVNLSENEMPAFAKDLGRKTFALANNADLWDAPSETAVLVDRLSKGLALTASGITENGYLEIILKKGGVGYIADGEKLLADAEKIAMGPPITIMFDPNGCAAGPEINALYEQIYARQAAKLKEIEDAEYPNDAARDAALTKFENEQEGRSQYLKVRRSFKGLTVTGVAKHYESQSVYFAEPVEKVREVFRSLGVNVSKTGQIASRDIYAGIDKSGNPEYGQTDLGCGV